MSKRFNSRSGKKLFTASCSSLEELEGDGQPGQHEQLQMRSIDVQQRQPSPALRSLASPNTSDPRPVLSMSVTSLRFKTMLTLPDSMERRRPFRNARSPWPSVSGAFQVENDDTFAFPLFDVQAHIKFSFAVSSV